MATFFSNQTVWYWGSTAYPVQGTLTGDVTRSGNTVTLSNMSMALSWPPYASGAWDVSFSLNGTQVYAARLSAGTGSVGLNNISFAVGTTATSANVSWSSSDGYSGSFTVSFPSGASAPTGLATQVTARTWNSATMKTSVSSWGTGVGPNRLVIHLSPTYNDETYIRQDEANYSPFTATINNSSTAGTHQAFTMKGCHTLYPYIYAYNGSVDATTWGSAFYLPPAPPSATVTDDGYTLTKSKALLTLTGDQTNNNAATVTFYYRYKKSSDANYGNWVSMGTGSVTGSKTASLELDGSTTYNFQFLQQYQSQNSESVTVNYTTPAVPDQGILYGSVNGQSKRIRKLYGSVNGETKKIVKLYASVNGVSKLIYKDS